MPEELHGARENAAMLADLFANHKYYEQFRTQLNDRYHGHAGFINVIVGLSKALDEQEQATRDFYEIHDWYVVTEDIVHEFITECIAMDVLADPVKTVDRCIMH